MTPSPAGEGSSPLPKSKGKAAPRWRFLAVASASPNLFSSARNDTIEMRRRMESCYINKTPALQVMIMAIHENEISPLMGDICKQILSKKCFLLIEGVSTDEFTHKTCGRNLVIHVCLVNEVKHLYYGVYLFVVNVGGLNLKEQGEYMLL